jgi:hypothetical protein
MHPSELQPQLWKSYRDSQEASKGLTSVVGYPTLSAQGVGPLMGHLSHLVATCIMQHYVPSKPSFSKVGEKDAAHFEWVFTKLNDTFPAPDIFA